MTNKSVKIFEIKGSDWMRGFARQTSSMLGGIFRSVNNFDPFETNGFFQPGYAPNALSLGGSASTPSFMTPFSTGGLGYIYAHGATKLYKIRTSDNAITDETSNVTTGAAFGAGIWRNKYVYALSTEVRKIELGAGTDTQLLSGLTASIPHVMCTGADLGLNQYVTNGNLIAKLILETGTAGNSLNAFTLETGQIARDLCNDGRYLVIISDNNSSGSTEIKSKCTISFWDMVKSSADQIYTVDDTSLIGAKIIDGVTYIIGYDNIWACTVGSAPQIVYSFTGNATITYRPSSASMLSVRNGILYWAGSNGQIYGYGNPFDKTKKIFFSPYTCSGTPTAICATTTKFYASNSNPGIDELQIGTGTRTTSDFVLAPIDFGQRFQYAYTKVVLKSPIASAEFFELRGINNWDGNGVITTSDVRNFSTHPGQSTMLFYRTPINTVNDVDDFEQMSLITIEVGKKAVVRLAIYATPLEDQYQK